MTTASGLRLEVFHVTPEWARKVLAHTEQHHGKQRHLQPTYLQDVEDQLRLGNWRLNGESIILDQQGRCLNGQHRLWACVNTGLPFDSVLVRGVDHNDFATIDQGNPRAVHQLIAMELNGTETAVDTRTRSSLSYRGLLWERNPTGAISPVLTGPKRGPGFPKPTRQDVLEYHRAHQSELEWAMVVTRGLKRLLTPTHSAFCAFAISRVEHALEPPSRFFYALREGVYPPEVGNETQLGLLSDDPIYALRERLINADGRRDSALTKAETIWLTMTMWNRWARNEGVGAYVRVPRDGVLCFPQLHGVVY